VIIKVVLDTNVLVSSLLASGPPAAVVDLVAEGKIKSFYNDQIIAEYLSVLRRPKFSFSHLQISRLVDDIVRTGIAVEINNPPSDEYIIPISDENDRVFLNVAKASHAILITGNIKHFPFESFIVTPADFLLMKR